MDLDKLKQVLELAREFELAELEVEQDGLRVKMRKDAPVTVVHAAPPQVAAHAPAPASSGAGHHQASAPVPVASPAVDTDVELAVVKSPIVGTFYRAAEPGAPVFVEVGSVVKKGQVLCIIEAMKLMNEIDSDYDGEIVSIYVENGQPVQYGERLFAIRAK